MADEAACSRLVVLERSDNQPWGFRLIGGANFNYPFVVQNVLPSSIAEGAGLRSGDIILEIAGQETSCMKHEDALRAILRCGNHLEFQITTPEPSLLHQQQHQQHLQQQQQQAQRTHFAQRPNQSSDSHTAFSYRSGSPSFGRPPSPTRSAAMRSSSPSPGTKITLPPVKTDTPDQILPSLARNQQTYIAHPPRQPLPRSTPPASPFGMGNSVPASPGGRSRFRPNWPPRQVVSRPMKMGFSPDVAPAEPAKFVWPPPRQNSRSRDSSVPPFSVLNGGGVAGAWDPALGQDSASGVPRTQFVTTSDGRRVATTQWPPPRSGGPASGGILFKQSSLPDRPGRRMVAVEQVLVRNAVRGVPQMYHVPPGTQHITTPHGSMSDIHAACEASA